MANKIIELYLRLCATAVFKDVLKTPLLTAFFAFCESESKEKKLKNYALFVSEIYLGGGSLPKLLRKLVFEDENVYIKAKARGEKLSPLIEQATEKELETFGAFSALSHTDFAVAIGVEETLLPRYESGVENFVEGYRVRIERLNEYGYGVFSSTAMFRLSDDKKIEPIASSDKIGMGHFIGYEKEREKALENTLAFLEGRPAANVLLCGDAGTGKSSTVKALVNEYFERGLRLIELRKDQLGTIPYIMGKIRENPLKFIIFIDDLSFNQNDDNFSMLKAALEGSAAARADNALIYATSNRRHIIKENFADREGDDVHRNDTLQETLSLSERFGLVISFSKPDKKLYLKIVNELAKRLGVTLPQSELELKAEAFALKKGSRSARCAEQFIDSLL